MNSDIGWYFNSEYYSIILSKILLVLFCVGFWWHLDHSLLELTADQMKSTWKQSSLIQQGECSKWWKSGCPPIEWEWLASVYLQLLGSALRKRKKSKKLTGGKEQKGGRLFLTEGVCMYYVRDNESSRLHQCTVTITWFCCCFSQSKPMCFWNWRIMSAKPHKVYVSKTMHFYM